MKYLISIICFISWTACLGQTFSKYKNTSFYNTTIVTDGKTKYDDVKYEYIKKGDTVLLVHKDYLNKFLLIFEKYPASYDSIFKNLLLVGKKNKTVDDYDKVLNKTDYKTYSVISEITTHYGDNEVIWELKNLGYGLGHNPCYTNLIFKLKDKSLTGREKVDNLEFIKARQEECEM